MENDTDKLIEEQFKVLPPALQSAINATPWRTIVQQIGKENALDAEQIATLEQETLLILYAFEDPMGYVDNLVNEVKITEDSANEIADEVLEKVFNPIQRKSEEVSADRKIDTGGNQDATASKLPEVAPEIHPMAEEGEVAHEVPHVEPAQPIDPSPIPAPAPAEPTVPQMPRKPSYTDGVDPYREPLE